MYRILFTVGSFSIYSYGLMIALAFITAILLAMKEAKKSGENPERVLDISLYVILGALIGGRLAYVLQYLDYYLKNPITLPPTLARSIRLPTAPLMTSVKGIYIKGSFLKIIFL